MPEPDESEERVQRALEELRADYRARLQMRPARAMLTVGLVALFRPGRILYPGAWQRWADLALHACAAGDSVWGVRRLLRMDAGLDSRDSISGATPLGWAAGAGAERTARLLIALGADVNARDDSGDAPLARAAEEGRTAIVEMLLDSGAGVDAPGHLGFTPLIHAAGCGSLEVVQLLVERGADPRIAGVRGLDAARWAELHGRSDCAHWLRAKGP
jgi:hypothetical protein